MKRLKHSDLICLMYNAHQDVLSPVQYRKEEKLQAYVGARAACMVAGIDPDSVTLDVYMTEGMGYKVDEDGSYI